MRKLILLGALTTVLLGVSASGASATTWSGTCHQEGKVVFTDSPYTFRIEHHDFEIFGSGSCEGTLNGAPYNGPATLYVDGRMNKPMSCEFGISDDVPSVLTFGDDPRVIDAPKLEVRISEFHLGTEAPFHMAGAYNGQGWGHLRFFVDQATLEGCAADGINEIEYVLDAHTITPMYG